MVESVKLSIELTEEQREGYPVSSESLWFDKVKNGYQLKNIPFFIDDLSFDDVISVSEITEGYYEIISIVEKSLNSTIWLCFSVDTEAEKKVFLDQISKLDCGYESGVLEGYVTVNVPEKVNIDKVYSMIDKAEKIDILVADYPSIRH